MYIYNLIGNRILNINYMKRLILLFVCLFVSLTSFSQASIQQFSKIDTVNTISEQKITYHLAKDESPGSHLIKAADYMDGQTALAIASVIFTGIGIACLQTKPGNDPDVNYMMKTGKTFIIAGASLGVIAFTFRIPIASHLRKSGVGMLNK